MPHGGYFVLMMLQRNNAVTMSEIGKELCIPKPNVTPIVDKLVDSKLVERISDSNDRRIVRIKITQKGLDAIVQVKVLMQDSIKGKIALLSENDLDKLSASLVNIKDVLQKIQ
jgi:DNA-binding MarR family transcriptional regulator